MPPPMTTPPALARASRTRAAGAASAGASSSKLVLMALINAFGVADDLLGVPRRVVGHPRRHASCCSSLADCRLLHASARVPLKYLLPGLVFLLVFQVFIFGYTGYIAFTNYGTGHAGTQEQAVEAALIQGERRVEDSPDLPAHRRRASAASSASRSSTTATVKVGTADAAAAGRRADAVVERRRATDVPGWDVVAALELLSDQELQTAGRRPARPGLGRPERRARSAPATRINGAVYTLHARVGRSSPDDHRHRRRAPSTTPTDDGSFVADDGIDAARRLARRSSASRTSSRLFTDPNSAEPLAHGHGLDVRVRDPLGRRAPSARTAARAHLQRRARARPQGAAHAVHPPVRLPRVHVGAAVPRHVQRRVRRHQRPVLLRRQHQLARRPVARARRRAVGEPVAQLSRTGSWCARARCRRFPSDALEAAAIDGAGQVTRSSARSSCRCCSSRRRRCDRVVRRSASTTSPIIYMFNERRSADPRRAVRARATPTS